MYTSTYNFQFKFFVFFIVIRRFVLSTLYFFSNPQHLNYYSNVRASAFSTPRRKTADDRCCVLHPFFFSGRVLFADTLRRRMLRVKRQQQMKCASLFPLVYSTLYTYPSHLHYYQYKISVRFGSSSVPCTLLNVK